MVPHCIWKWKHTYICIFYQIICDIVLYGPCFNSGLLCVYTWYYGQSCTLQHSSGNILWLVVVATLMNNSTSHIWNMGAENKWGYLWFGLPIAWKFVCCKNTFVQHKNAENKWCNYTSEIYLMNMGQMKQHQRLTKYSLVPLYMVQYIMILHIILQWESWQTRVCSPAEHTSNFKLTKHTPYHTSGKLWGFYY